MKKQFLGVILGAAIMGACISASAAALAPETISVQSEQQDGIPVKTDTKLLDSRLLGGQTKLKADTCYFVEDTVTIDSNLVLPESSMIVIRNGGTLRISSGGKLTLKGSAVIHDKGKVHISKGGALVVKSTSALVNYGTIAVSKGGYAGIYGYAQSEGAVNVKGRLYILKNGVLAAEKVKKYNGSAVKGEVQPLPKRPLYFAQQLGIAEGSDMYVFSEINGEEYHVESESERSMVAKSFEKVLYKYAGEIVLPEMTPACDYIIDIQYEVFAEIAGDGGTKRIISGTTDWGGIPFVEENDFDRVLHGCYYQAVLGSQDKALLLTLLD
ncbi:MAG: hypothetical protein ACI4WS_07755 [Oscillospiraceae bacterium]